MLKAHSKAPEFKIYYYNDISCIILKRPKRRRTLLFSCCCCVVFKKKILLLIIIEEKNTATTLFSETIKIKSFGLAFCPVLLYICTEANAPPHTNRKDVNYTAQPPKAATHIPK